MRPRVTAVRCHEFGDPAEVLRVEQVPLPEVGPGQVRVQMRAAPVNPADINVIQGRYGSLPELPATCGNEGAGVVQQVGPGVTDVAPGQHVRPEPGVGCWCQELVTGAERLIRLPGGLTDEQAAVISVNAATAYRMLRDFVELSPGQWVLQNAATSAVGRYVIQLCRRWGLRSASLVRRQEAVAELEALGADLVLLEGTRLARELPQLTGGQRPRLALNAVGGHSAANLAGALAPGGTLVTYGAMGLKPLTVPNGPLIFGELRLRGFWVTAWYRRSTRAQADAMFAELAPLYADGTLDTFVEARYALQQAPRAVAHARQEGRRGKVLLQIADSSSR
jgi:trans-2-enoyl-CoA reductase